MDAIYEFLTNSAVIETLGPVGIGLLALAALGAGAWIATRPSNRVGTGLAGEVDNTGGTINITALPPGAWIAFAAGALLAIVAILSAGDETQIDCGYQSGNIIGSEVTISCD